MATKSKFSDVLSKIAFVIAVLLTLFQSCTALFGVLTAVYQRAIHLGLASSYIFLFNMATPKEKGKVFHIIINFIGLVASAGSNFYICLHYAEIQGRLGITTELDMIFGALLLVAILIMGYESLGWALPTISVIFLLYGLFGHLIPGALSHQAFTFKRLISFLYLGTEGVFGSAMSVSATFIFIFILFGAFLEKSGAGRFFVNLALTATGRVTGGPALAAVASSALMGTISGSGVSNVVTTGTFTIPLMKANGYDKNFAGAVEAVASNGGQILPPVMGSVAFLMAEMIGVSYFAVAKAAAVPALLYFFAVGIAVYFEAKRLNLRPDPNAQYERVGVVFKSGFYYLLPIALLIVFIICGYSVLRAGAYAAILTIALSYVKKDTSFHLKDFGAVVSDVAKQVRPIVAACACAGIIMGITSLTNLGIKLSGLIVTVSQGNLMIALVMTMLVSLVMGMGLPTTAAYLLLAVLGAPALIKLGADPLPAHLFILYFGCMSTITPPVALSTYAAAGISGGSPMKTGIYAMKLASVAFLIPYIFVYGQELLLYGSLGSILLAILSASLGCVALAGGMIGWLGAKMPMPLRFVLVGAAITLMIPGALTDVIGVVLMAACVITAVTLSKRQTPKIQ